MKYLFVSSDKYPPFRIDVTVLFGEEMAKRGHTIDWLLQSEDACPADRQTTWRDFTVYVGATNNGESLWQRLHKHYLGIKHDLKIFSLARRHSYDFIQVKDKFIAALFGLIAARRQRQKFVYWLSYPFPEASLYEARTGAARYPLLYKIRGHVFDFLLYRIITRYADHVFVQSEQMRKDVLARGVDGDKVTPVPMGVETELLDMRRDYAVAPEQMVYLGTLLQTRKLDFLVRVLARVRNQIPNAHLYLVGPEELPGDMDILREEARRLGVTEGLTLTGRLERSAALEIVGQSSVCFSPFYPTPILNSTSPTKLIEYMALGKAVVANDHPEQQQVIETSGSGFCVPYDEEAFADAAIKLLEDPQLVTAMAQPGIDYVRANRTYAVLALHLEAAYQQLIGETDGDT